MDMNRRSFPIVGGISFGVLLLAVSGGAPPEKGAGAPPDPATCPAPGKVSPQGWCLDEEADAVWVPAGKFIMGAEQGEWDPNEQPKRKVYLDGFWIDRTEVSTEQYGRCVRKGGCTDEKLTGEAWFGRPFTPNKACNWAVAGRKKLPINCLTWAQADAYCRWACKALPTEAQWEKAARGPKGRTYPWGEADPTCKLAVYGDCYGSKQRPVGSLPAGASPYGALDMAGNVWEWVADLYQDSYRGLPDRNPVGPRTGTDRIFRGGAHYVNETFLRAANRRSQVPSYRHVSVGFRCVSAPAKR